MRAKTVILIDHPPGGVHRMLSLVPRSDGVPPVILIRIATPRPAQYRDTDLLKRIHHIHPDMITRPETIIDTSPEILGKMPIQVTADHRARGISYRQAAAVLREQGKRKENKSQREKGPGSIHML